MRISVIIPTHNREALLLWVLKELEKQTLRHDLFEVIVVSDGLSLSNWIIEKIESLKPAYRLEVVEQDKAGPATARNLGSSLASGDILLFIGDDCIPDRNLLWRHHQAHLMAENPSVVQGYTPWYPDMPPDEFMKFLTDGSGIQANWKALKNQDGSWKKEAGGWFLTTNCSIDAREFRNIGGFDEEFKYAAWEDIELSFRLAKQGIKTLFCPDAINYHFHRISLKSYIKRQFLEGESRIILCKRHPEIAPTLISPENLRNIDESVLLGELAEAENSLFLRGDGAKEFREKRWFTALQIASVVGIHNSLKKNKRYWQVVKHLHLEDELRFAVGACAALDSNNASYATFEAQWAILSRKENWALYALMAEVSKAVGDLDSARNYIIKSIQLGPGEPWPLEVLKEL